MELYYILSIVDRKKAKDMLDIHNSLQLSAVFTKLGQGTATAEYHSLYDLDPGEIRFGAGGELFLQLGDVKVALGTGENLDEKISRLKQLEGDLKDKSGTLHMENYTDETTHISLESAK